QKPDAGSAVLDAGIVSACVDRMPLEAFCNGLARMRCSQDRTRIETFACGLRAHCSSQAGVSCSCDDGYIADSTGTCVVNELCSTNPCGPSPNSCTVASDGYSCNCSEGYTGSGTTACTDIDECASENGGCDPLVTCSNLPGGRSC